MKEAKVGSCRPERKNTMDRQKLIERFENEMAKISRTGADKLMEYIRKSDFYTAPASTKYHLACEGGLLQHSLNVLDALRTILVYSKTDNTWQYQVAGKVPAIIPDESVTIMALLHDICKTYFYGTSTRNVKNEKTGKWEKAPFYTIEDRMPLGHGAKSAMIIKQYMDLTNMEMYAIWWHMGFNGEYENDTCVGAAIEKYPVVLDLQTADMQASKIMEAETGNKPLFVTVETKPEEKPRPKPKAKPQTNTESSVIDFDETDYQEAPPLQPEEANG